ncbi:uncharacterized protein LOC118399428 isoform X6 [Oncorhynchus keta]|uniref:uncharacterized protein LOC118399428 isoform X5 n=1 Tax=Oncorhynchus keta TaxID=8018 RepID=UPI00227B284C|nr:uncharacterized protein LOC118399428 isoform X5 [Oncorhynchus keta]XP_052328054.1 uncharacterized protein LOC118399428 isoform X6 [Oncorhynchus keta]
MVLPSANHLRITQCILIFAISGSLSVPYSVTPAGMSTTPTNKMVFQMDIKITNLVFNDSLLNPNSEDYKKLYGEVSQLLADAYKSPSSGTASTYEGVATMTFRKGSVIANTIIVFNTTFINGLVVKFDFLNHIEANPSALLQIDTNSIECSLSVPYSVTPAGMSTTPTNKMVFQMDIKITNRVFNDSLLNRNSEDYKKLYGEVSQLLADAYKSPSSGTASTYEGVATMTFRKGSVIANTIIVFNTTFINGLVVKFDFLNHIEANPSALLQIDTNSIECSLSVPYSVTPAGMSTTPTNKMVFQMDIKITNRVFNDSLLNPNSEDYKKLYGEVSQLLADAYKSPTSGTASTYEGVATMTFRNGSVIANADIVFNTHSINGFVVKFEFLNYIDANPSALLQIDTNYIE